MSNIVFFGTSEFAVPILEKLVEAGFRPVLVVTTPDAPKGKKQILTPSPVKVKTQALGLETHQPVTLKTPEAKEAIRAVRPFVGVLAAYGKIIPKAVIDLFPKGILNVHPSLLPRWRGPTPIQATILAGDEKTGVTIISIDEEVDHGPILAKSEIPILAADTYESLHEKLASLGANLLAETLSKWLNDEILPATQAHTKATFCHKFTREDAKIDWVKPAEEIDRQIRALNPEPGTYTRYKEQGVRDKELKILRATPIPYSISSIPSNPGEVFEYEKKLAVRCGEGALVLETIQPEGKQPMSAGDFVRGHREFVGQILSA